MNERLPVIAPVDRHAQALADMRAMHEEHAELRAQAELDHREIIRLQDQVAALKEQLSESRQHERIVSRKLVRLATSVEGFGKLADAAKEVMLSVKEWQEETGGDGADEVVTGIIALHEGKQ